jgi:Leucine-rich repeat (LRR) protein
MKMKNIFLLLILLSFFPQKSKAQVSQGDFEALVALYNATEGDNWKYNTNWNINGKAEDVTSDWYGVVVNGGRVTRIFLEDNNLVGNLPPEIGNLDALLMLYVKSNQIASIPPEIGNLTLLGTLEISSNQLTNLPPEIGGLNKLINLHLTGNKLTSLLPEIGNLTLLGTLEISSNQLTNLPPEIGGLNKLINLHLTGNKLTSLPPEIGNLSSLTTLLLDYNQLVSLPPQIGNLNSLTVLWLRHNLLASLPPEIGNLTSLIYLYIKDNQLTSLPSEIGNLTSLKRLFIEDNQLTSLPAEIGLLPSLTWLKLIGNQLTSLPLEITDLPLLTHLHLEYNQLTSLPVEVNNMTSLSYLTAWHNKLTFEDIEPNLDIPNFYYFQQDTLIPINKVDDDLSNTTKLVVCVEGENNNYLWYKDGVEISDSNNDTLTNPGVSGAGGYYCEITNTLATELTLKSDTFMFNSGYLDLNPGTRENEIQIFPNPTKGEFLVNLDNKPINGCRLEIYNLQGHKMYTEKLTKIQNELSLDMKLNGIYILKIVEYNNVLGSYRVMFTD